MSGIETFVVTLCEAKKRWCYIIPNFVRSLQTPPSAKVVLAPATPVTEAIGRNFFNGTVLPFQFKQLLTPAGKKSIYEQEIQLLANNFQNFEPILAQNVTGRKVL